MFYVYVAGALSMGAPKGRPVLAVGVHYADGHAFVGERSPQSVLGAS
jgi:hypothetical protein